MCEQIKIPGFRTKILLDPSNLGKIRCIACNCLTKEIIEKNGLIGCKNCLF